MNLISTLTLRLLLLLQLGTLVFYPTQGIAQDRVLEEYSKMLNMFCPIIKEKLCPSPLNYIPDNHLVLFMWKIFKVRIITAHFWFEI